MPGRVFAAKGRVRGSVRIRFVAATTNRRPARWPWLALGLALLVAGLQVARGCGVAGGRIEYDEEDLARARSRWESTGPASYGMEIEVRGARRAHHEIEVRGGTVTAMTTDGEPVPERVWEAWSVEALFGILADELRHARDRTARGEPAPLLLAAFDGKTGAPVSFLRHEQGATLAQEWEIVRLMPFR